MTRSRWGWGTVLDAVTGAEADELVARVAALPDHDFSVHEPPEVADLGLPQPRVSAPDALARIASDDPTDRAAHAHGKAYRDARAPRGRRAACSRPRAPTAT